MVVACDHGCGGGNISSLVTSLTYSMASMVALWSGGCAYSDTHPFQEFCQSR